MADYINSNILCQAYVHIDPVEIPEEKLELLRKELELFVTTRGRFFLYNEVNTKVEFKEGSLKVYGTILGALYIAIGQYGSFRSGVDYLAQDTKRLAECIASESLFLSQSRHKNILRVEARTGVAGNLKSIIDTLEQISRELADKDASISAKHLAEARDKIESLLGKLLDPKDIPFVKSGLCELFKELFPQIPPQRSKPKEHHTIEGLKYYREERHRLKKLIES